MAVGEPNKFIMIIMAIALLVLLTVGICILEPWKGKPDKERVETTEPVIPEEQIIHSTEINEDKEPQTGFITDPIPTEPIAGITESLPPMNDLVQIIFSHGVPLDRVALRAVKAAGRHERVIAKGKPEWAIKTNEQGEIARDRARSLGNKIAFRIEDYWTELMTVCWDNKTVTVEAPVAQEFRLDPEVHREGVEATCVLVSREACGYIDGLSLQSHEFDEPFVDHCTVDVADIDTPSSVVCAKIKVGGNQAVRTVDLPKGSYILFPFECTMGWWLDHGKPTVTGEPIIITPYPVPVVPILLPIQKDGSVQAPEKVFICVKRPTSSGMRRQPFDVQGNMLRVSLNERPPAGTELKSYAFELEWGYNDSVRTEFVDWHTLLGGFDMSTQDG